METLRSHIATLACVEETSAPFVSCYINLEQGKGSYDKVLEERASTVRSTIEKSAHADFDAAMHEIKSYLAKKVRPDAKGVAIFSRQLRTGNFFLPMQFAAPLPNWMAVYDVPKGGGGRDREFGSTASAARGYRATCPGCSSQAWLDLYGVPRHPL